MNKAKLNYFIDLLLIISFILVFATGIIKWPALGLPIMKNTTIIHDLSGLVMGILVFIHLVLHWNWLVCMTKSIVKKK